MSTLTAPVQAPPVTRSRLRPILLVAGTVALLAVLALLHLAQGGNGVGLGDVLRYFTGSADVQAHATIVGSRGPRTLAGLVVGLALGIAGVLVQGVTRNPLAAPDTLGVNAGAYLAVTALAVSGVQVGVLPRGGAAFVGGLLAAGMLWLLTAGSPATPGRVLLAGTAVAQSAMAVATLMLILKQQETQGLFFWGNGSLLQSSIDRPATLGVVVALVGALVFLLARQLDLLALGDESAQALGVSVGRVRAASLVLAVLLSAAAVTVAGPVGFVGLLAPLAVRRAGVRTHAWLLPLSGAAGAALVLGADLLARATVSAGSAGELPVGVVTALVGGPVFIWVARQLVTGDAGAGAGVTVGRLRDSRAYAAVIVAGVAALCAAALIGLRLGDVSVSFSQVLSAVIGRGDVIATGVVEVRGPRIVISAVVGGCLAAAGVATQAAVRNPLAEPGLLGVTGGATVGAVAIITIWPAGPAWMLPMFTAIGAVLAVAIVLLLAGAASRRQHLDPVRVVLVGVGMAATTASVVQLLALRAQLNLTAALTWMAGSTYARDWPDLQWLVVPLIATAVLFTLSRPLDLLGYGEEVPQALGLRLGRARVLVFAAATALASGVAATVGAVGFVGLVAPHLARRIVGPSHRRLIPVAVLAGAVLVVLSDALGRYLLHPQEIPIGVVTAVVGAPYLIWLLRGRRSA